MWRGRASALDLQGDRVRVGVEGEMPIIAEDLGVITPDVEALRDDFGFPGMRVLQFAFRGDSKTIDLPHNFIRNCVVYTGTHDNDTTVGWFNSKAVLPRLSGLRRQRDPLGLDSRGVGLGSEHCGRPDARRAGTRFARSNESSSERAGQLAMAIQGRLADAED